MKEFAHDCDNGLLASFSIFSETVRKLFEERIEGSSGHCRHEESASQVGGSNLGNRGGGASRSSTLIVSGSEPSPGGELTCV